MRKDFDTLFTKLPKISPREGLGDSILTTLLTRKRRAIRIYLACVTSLSAFSFASLIPSIQYLLTEMQQSGMYEYLSLAYSDSEIVLSHLQDFLLTLAESVPLLGLIAIFGAFFVLISSLQYIIKNSRTAFHSQLT